MSEMMPLNIINPNILVHSPIPHQQQHRVKKQNTFKCGTFMYIRDLNTRNMLINAWNAIKELHLWEFVASPQVLYLGNDDPYLVSIKSKMYTLGYKTHTEYSFNWVMKQMQYIAENGEQEYMYEIIKQSKQLL